MTAFYFSYGSNLHPDRMRARVPGARVLGAARLPHARLVCNKLGRDGSAKANFEPAPASCVWGVLWTVPERGWPELDLAEGGYERIEVLVEHLGVMRPAETYRSSQLTSRRVLREDYKRWMVDGAREQGLPSEWIALLEALPAL